MGNTIPDYANSAFQYPVLDKIVGQPTYESLKTLKQQIKANAQTVGDFTTFGYLGLVLTPQEFAQVHNVPFARPADPGPLNIPQFTPAHEALRRQSDHQEQKRRYRECILVEQALLKQLVAAVDEVYTQSFCNCLTNSIQSTIPTILGTLFRKYGRVTSEQLRKEEEKMQTYFWEPNDAPDELFNKVEDLAFFADAANLPKTASQIINYGLDAVRKTGQYERALIEWYEKAEIEQTWNNFKTHFTEAQQQLRQVRGDTMRNTPFHQANLALQEEVRRDFQRMRDEVVQSLNVMATEVNNSNSVPPPDSANAATRTSTTAGSNRDDELAAMFRAMTTQLTTMNSRITDILGQNNGAGRGGGDRPNGNRQRRNMRFYCWTHGACNHPGSACRNPKPGHKNEATFEDRMGGSNFYCRQAMEAANNNE